MSDDFNATVLAVLVRLEGTCVRLEAGQAERRANLLGLRTAVMDRIDRLRDDVTETRDNRGVNIGGLEHVWRQIAADRDAIAGLRDTISVMQRHIRRLQERGES